MLGFPLGILSAAGAGGVAGATYELISTQILGSAQATITFSSLAAYASTYKHLQIRAVSRTDRSGEYADPLRVRLNGNTSAEYARHQMEATDAGVTSGGIADQTSMFGLGLAGGGANSTIFAASIIDLLDVYSTTKFKTGRGFSGVMGITSGGNQNIRLASGLLRSTVSTSSIEITATNSFQSGSRFSLYGIRG